MKLNRFLSLLAACIGLGGAMIMAWSFLLQTPETMLSLTSPYSRIDYAPEQIASLADQKADTLIGVLWILLAFLVEIVSLLFVKEDTEISFAEKIRQGLSTLIGMAIIVIIVVALAWGSRAVDFRIARHNKLEMGKLAVKNHLSFIRREKMTPDIQYIEQMCKDLLNLNKNGSESSSVFLKRVEVYVGENEPQR